MRVENLRDSYDLFQMKPVAVTRGKAFFDLTDGTRVAEKSPGGIFRHGVPGGQAMGQMGEGPGRAAGIRQGRKS